MKKKFIFIIGMAMLSSYSCQKALLYPASQTQVSNQDYAPFSTSARIYAQLLGLYSNLKSGQMFGGRYQVYNEVKADNWINITANSVTTYQTWGESASSTSSEVLNLWSQAYFTINNCNLFIDGMAAAGNAVLGNASLSANYVGEAKLIRALSYYALLQFYCQPYGANAGNSPGLPLRLTGLSSDGNYDLAPVTVAAVYAQVLADLNAAETALPLTYSDALTNTIRVHRNTAIALKTRVYLAMQQYANVITEANKIVSATAPFTATSGVANALQTDITKVFASPYTTTESMFSAPFTTTETPGTQNQLGFYFNANGTKAGNAEYYLNPAGVIADPTWKTTDKRRTFVYTSTVSGHTTQQFLSKFPTLSPYNDYAPIIRYAEVLLNLAEARARVAAPTAVADIQALALLNAVRQRSDPSTILVAVTNADLIPLIMEERNIEFLGEGFRWQDLVRLQATIPAKSNVAATPATSPNYIWPMSGNEQLTNKLIGR